MHCPDADEDRKALAMRVATVYAEAVVQRIAGLRCGAEEKAALLVSVRQQISTHT